MANYRFVSSLSLHFLPNVTTIIRVRTRLKVFVIAYPVIQTTIATLTFTVVMVINAILAVMAIIGLAIVLTIILDALLFPFLTDFIWATINFAAIGFATH